jgi:hypothetical protein
VAQLRTRLTPRVTTGVWWLRRASRYPRRVSSRAGSLGPVRWPRACAPPPLRFVRCSLISATVRCGCRATGAPQRRSFALGPAFGWAYASLVARSSSLRYPRLAFGSALRAARARLPSATPLASPGSRARCRAVGLGVAIPPAAALAPALARARPLLAALVAAGLALRASQPARPCNSNSNSNSQSNSNGNSNSTRLAARPQRAPDKAPTFRVSHSAFRRQGTPLRSVRCAGPHTTRPP